MKHPFSEYKTLIFDCDGVVLNSNAIKTQAFYDSTKHYGHDAAQAMVRFHIANGGISRYAKARYFISEILRRDFDESIYSDILRRFRGAVMDALLRCEVTSGLAELRGYNKDVNWLIVSGGDQWELREVFKKRGLNAYFNGGIFGSPDNKRDILKREMERCNVEGPSLFLGDSLYDYKVSTESGIDFMFVSDWTEFSGWRDWVDAWNIDSIGTVAQLLDCS